MYKLIMEEKKKIKVRYVCRIFGEFNKGQVWGGTYATNYTIKKCFENDNEIDFEIKSIKDFNNVSEIKDWIELADVSWVDPTPILEMFYKLGYKRPNIIGPIAKSPVKRFGIGIKEAMYDKNWFYHGVVIRLNENEEKSKMLKEEFKGQDFLSKVSFIRHAIDLETWKPLEPWNERKRKYVLWAGDKFRGAKNYQMWEEIQKLCKLPEGYEFKTLHNYNIDTYKMILDETAILVNTSLYESFCCAVNEARAKGVPTLVRKGLNGEIMFLDQPIQVEYTPQDYATKIEEILQKSIKDEDYLEKLGMKTRKWAEKNISLKTMRDDLVKVIKEIYNEKK